MLPYLLVTGLCLGAVAGVINYDPADYALHLSPTMARAIESSKNHNERLTSDSTSSSKAAARTTLGTTAKPVSWNAAGQVFAPAYQNYQVAVTDSQGIKLKTIVSR